jgi:hypothetical protein
VLIETVMLASIASWTGNGGPIASNALRAAPVWGTYLLAVQAPWHLLRLASPCFRSRTLSALPCAAFVPNPDVGAAVPAAGSYAEPDVELPSVSRGVGGTLGGFVNFDVMERSRLSVGPELYWLTPDSPREDLLRLKVVAPGWGVSYSLDDANVSVGVAVCTRFVMLGEDMPVVDVLTSEARLEVRLP